MDSNRRLETVVMMTDSKDVYDSISWLSEFHMAGYCQTVFIWRYSTKVFCDICPCRCVTQLVNIKAKLCLVSNVYC